MTLPLPCVAPKPEPTSVMMLPVIPIDGVRLVSTAETTVNAPLLLERPPTVTTTGPLVAPDGTVPVIEVALHAVTNTCIPLSVTVLDP
jgi:hypothetical protein